MDTMTNEEIGKINPARLDEATIDRIARTAAKLMDGVTTFAQLKGISHEELEAVYSIGLGYYRTGRYEDAEKLFRVLILLSHTSPKYYTALGAVRQACRQYKEAMQAYAAAAMFDLHKPKPHFYAAQCALALGDLDAAESGCRSLLHYCPASPENNEFRAKAEKLLESVQNSRK